MELIKPSEICYSKVIRTQYGYVVQDFTYRKYLDKAKAYFEGEGVALCGRNAAEFEYHQHGSVHRARDQSRRPLESTAVRQRLGIHA